MYLGVWLRWLRHHEYKAEVLKINTNTVHMIFHTHCFFFRFSEGLKTVGVLQAIQSHGDTMKSFFIHADQPIVAEDIFCLYKPALFSPDGSNRKKKEDETMSWWRDMVLDMEGKSQHSGVCIVNSA